MMQHIFPLIATLLLILILLLGGVAEKFRSAGVPSGPSTTTRAPSLAPPLTPEALTYYCAGQAGIPLHGTVSSSQMVLLSDCIDQQKHRLRAK